MFRRKICVMEFLDYPPNPIAQNITIEIITCNSIISLEITVPWKFGNNCSRQTLFQKKPYDNVSCRNTVHASTSPFHHFLFLNNRYDLWQYIRWLCKLQMENSVLRYLITFTHTHTHTLISTHTLIMNKHMWWKCVIIVFNSRLPLCCIWVHFLIMRCAATQVHG